MRGGDKVSEYLVKSVFVLELLVLDSIGDTVACKVRNGPDEVDSNVAASHDQSDGTETLRGQSNEVED